MLGALWPTCTLSMAGSCGGECWLDVSLRMLESPSAFVRQDEDLNVSSSMLNVCLTHPTRMRLTHQCGDEGLASDGTLLALLHSRMAPER